MDHNNPTEEQNLIAWVHKNQQGEELPEWAQGQHISEILMASTQAIVEQKWKLADNISRLGHEKISGTNASGLRLKDVLGTPRLADGTQVSVGAGLRMIIETLTHAFYIGPTHEEYTIPLQLVRDIIDLAIEED